MDLKRFYQFKEAGVYEKSNVGDNGETLRLGFIDFWQNMVYNVGVKTMSLLTTGRILGGIYYDICKRKNF